MRITRIMVDGLHGLDVDIALDALPDGLIAVCGSNGSGKTTIMESMLPVPLTLAMPSRPGPLHQRVSLDRRDYRMRVDIEHDGAEYACRIDIDPGTGTSGATVRAYLDVDGVLIEDTAKGDQRAYLQAVAEHLPDARLLMASAYAAQDRDGDLLSMAPAERRDIFARLLGLDQLQTLSARAARARLDCQRHLSVAEQQAEQLGAEAAQVGEVEAQLPALREARDAAVAAATATAERLAVADRAVADAQARLDAADRARSQHARLVAAARQRVAVGESAGRRAAADLDAAREAARKLAELGNPPDVAGFEAMEAAAMLARQDARDAFTAATARRDALTGPALAEARAELSRREAEAGGVTVERAAEREAAAVEAVEDGRRALASATATSRDLAGSARQLAEAEQRAARLADVPCGGETLAGRDCGACPLIADARQAAATLDELRERAAAEDQAHAAHQAAERELRTREAELEQARRIHRAAAAVPAAREAAAAAEARETERAEICARIEGLAVAGRKAKERHEAAIAATRAARERLAEHQRLAEQADRLGDLRAAVERAEAEIADARAALEDIDRDAPEGADERAREDLAAARVARGEVAVDHRDTTAARDAAARALHTAEGRLAELVRRREQYAEACALRDRLTARVRALSLAERATGATGIQALLVDAAAPRIAEIANDLLGDVWGGRWSVAIRTQRALARRSADGRSTTETLDIVAHDGRHMGAERLPGELSGGEKVIIGEAVKLAVAVHNAERGGAGSEDLWRDECDGALDAEAAQQYAPLLRAALRVGGFRRCYYISHRPDVVAQADASIRMDRGRATIEVH